MLETASPMNRSMLSSALAGTSTLRPNGGGGHRRTMVASLMLTSLVDAFSILVIFLIMNHSTSQEPLNVGDKVQLPQAQSTSLIQQGVVVRIEDGRFTIDDKPVALGSLRAVLKKFNDGPDAAKKEGLVIVADKQLDYADLSPVILAGSSAGFTKFKFAVIKND
jgi:biopolymer transport protein ExbD